MAGYIRQDTTDQIANGQVIDAVYLDQEFNAIEAAFSVVGGHNHDGTTGEGAPITQVGPGQDIVVSSTNVLPKTTNTYDLGSATFKFKDAYVDGVLYVDGINYNGTVLLPTATELNYVDGVTSPIQTQIDALSAAISSPPDAELQALAGLVSAADRLPYFTGSGTAALATFTSFGRSLVDDADATAARATLGLNTMATQASSSVSVTGGSITGLTTLSSAAATLTSATISGGSITGITDLAVADGGTGVGTITGIIRGNGTSPFTAAVAGTDFLAPAAIGTTVQAYDADLAAIAALTSAADRVPYFTGSGTAALATFTSFGRSLVDDADATAARTTLGLGSLATLSSVTTSQIAAATLVTAAEGIASNDNDTTLPTSAAVKSYVDSASDAWQWSWHPYNKVTLGDSNDGIIWSFAANGAQGTINTPDFVAGYDYRISVKSLTSTAIGTQFVTLGYFRQVANILSPVQQVAGLPQTSLYDMSIEIYNPMKTGQQFRGLFELAGHVPSGGNSGQPGIQGIFTIGPYFTVADRILRMQISVSGGGNTYNGGAMYLERRKTIAN